MEFGLSRHHRAHTSDARCVVGCDGFVASGGRDSVLKLWLQEGDALAVKETKWVNAVAAIAPGQLKCCMHGGVVTGGQDGFIRIYSLEGQKFCLQHMLQAHSAAVCSLSWLESQGQLLLLSGGWDSVAKIWEVQSADDSKCQGTTLAGHENNVCVLGLANGDIITGSSGVRDEAADCVSGFQLRVWRKALVVQAIGEEAGGHNGAIRDLAAIPCEQGRGAFASASNDGTVAVWESGEAAAGAKYSRVLTLAVPSGSFVFSVCYAAPILGKDIACTGGTVFTGDDAGDLCIFDLSMRISSDKVQSTALSPVQCIRHPKTVWSVAVVAAATAIPQTEMSNMEVDACASEACAVATACADGVVRIFTTDCKLHLPATEQQESLGPEPASMLPAADGATMSTTLPCASKRDQFIGVLPGAISLFLDDELAHEPSSSLDCAMMSGASSAAAVVAFQWLDSNGTADAGWVKLGRVADPIPKQNSQVEQKAQQRKQELDGELFDQIIPVEVDSASQGHLNLLLGINVGDDPKSVATKFCQKHGLMDEYIPQIAMFVDSCS